VAWINLYEKGDFTKLHNHAFVDFSAVLILKPGEDSLLFHDNRNVQRFLKGFESYADQKINEKKGTLILFPSHLYHSVSECKIERISIAFNFRNDPKD